MGFLKVESPNREGFPVLGLQTGCDGASGVGSPSWRVPGIGSPSRGSGGRGRFPESERTFPEVRLLVGGSLASILRGKRRRSGWGRR